MLAWCWLIWFWCCDMNIINYLPILIVTFLISSAIFFALLLLLFFCFTFFSKLRGKISGEARSDGKSDLQDRAYLQAFSIIQEAKRDALKIVKDSNLRAQSIIKEAHVINKKSENMLEGEIEKAADVHIKVLESTSEDLLNFYKDMMEKERKTTMDTFEKASDDIQTAVLKDVDELKDVLHKETTEARQNVERELEEYRSRRIQEIDKKIYDIVYEITSKVLGKSLSMADQEAVIFKILDDIKQRGGLTASERR